MMTNNFNGKIRLLALPQLSANTIHILDEWRHISPKGAAQAAWAASLYMKTQKKRNPQVIVCSGLTVPIKETIGIIQIMLDIIQRTPLVAQEFHPAVMARKIGLGVIQEQSYEETLAILVAATREERWKDVIKNQKQLYKAQIYIRDALTRLSSSLYEQGLSDALVVCHPFVADASQHGHHAIFNTVRPGDIVETLWSAGKAQNSRIIRNNPWEGEEGEGEDS